MGWEICTSEWKPWFHLHSVALSFIKMSAKIIQFDSWYTIHGVWKRENCPILHCISEMFISSCISRLSVSSKWWRKSHFWYYWVLSTLRHICKKQNKLNNLIFLFCEANMCANKCCISVYKVTSHLLGKRETRFTCETVWQSDSDSGHIWCDKCFLSFYKVTSHQFWLRTHLMHFLNGRY